MKPITPFVISAPGFYGVNTQDSPVDLAPGFALRAINCVIDESGRIASRKGWQTIHAANADLGTSNVTTIGELIDNSGTSYVLCTGGGFLFKYAAGVLTTLTYGGGGVAPTIAANNWQFVQLNGVAMFFQRGYDTLIFDPAVSTTTFRRLSERSGSAGTFYQTHTALSAYGRVWSADNGTDKNTVVFSDILAPHIMTGGTSGSLNVAQVWPTGGDEVIALAAHNNFLFIFGRKQILVYSGADDPATMRLSDSIVGVGCIARDSVQNTGDDVIFLSDSGVRSVLRTVQEKSAPLRPISKNVLNELQTHILAETKDNIKSVYSKQHGFYLLTMPSFFECYCFDIARPLQDGSTRVTTWQNLTPSGLYEARDGTLYFGLAGNLATYGSYFDNATAYRAQYYTTWIDFGNPIQISILKKIILTLIGGVNQPIIFKWAYDFVQSYSTETVSISGIVSAAEFGITEYNSGAEYAGNLLVNTLSANGTRSGKVLQFGFEAQIQGSPISIQKIELFTKDGRL